MSLGLNIMEQEVIDMTNTIARNGLIFFPEFCQIVLKKFREDDESEFAQVMFKVTKTSLLLLTVLMMYMQMLCGTDPLPKLFRAKRYKIKQKFLTKSEFQFIMRNLPEEVSEADIEEMFDVADTDKDGKIGFQVTGRDVILPQIL